MLCKDQCRGTLPLSPRLDKTGAMAPYRQAHAAAADISCPATCTPGIRLARVPDAVGYRSLCTVKAGGSEQ